MFLSIFNSKCAHKMCANQSGVTLTLSHTVLTTVTAIQRLVFVLMVYLHINSTLDTDVSLLSKPVVHLTGHVKKLFEKYTFK